ncbi:MAG: hypothetical protein IJX30_03185 [Clostridia bacterium]|nr:hypothetical protein [Clostridia bacterium]
MANVTFTFNVNLQRIKLKSSVDAKTIVAGSNNLYYVHMDFSPLWDGAVKRVIFEHCSSTGEKKDKKEYTWTDSDIQIPASYYASGTTGDLVRISVYGQTVHECINLANYVEFKVQKSETAAVDPPDMEDNSELYVKTPNTATDSGITYIKKSDKGFCYWDESKKLFVPVLDAYQSALKGGYAGTETEFYEDVAKAADADAALALKADKSTTLAGYGIADGLQNKKIFSTQETGDLRFLVGPVDSNGVALYGGASSLPLHSVAMAEDIETLMLQVDELAGQLADLTCEHVKIVSFTISPTVAELGDELQATIAAQLDKAAATVTLFRGSTPLSCLVAGTTATATAAAVTTDTTFKIVVTDDLGHETTATKTLSFYNGVYTGVADAGAGIAGLSKTLQGGRNKTFTVTAGAGEYIYYACPVRYGTPVFKVGGFEGGFSLVSSGDFTNASGYTEGYQLWRSVNANLGAVTVTVS